MVINGIMFRTRAGCPWRDQPGEYGNWKTVVVRAHQHAAGARRALPAELVICS